MSYLRVILPFTLLVFALRPAIGLGYLSTTNETRIQKFWSAVQSSNGPVTVLSFGDSVSDDYRSVQASLFARMQERFGSKGVAFTGWAYKEVSGGATLVAWGPDWWADHFRVPPGGFVIWHPQQCNDVGVFWIARPGGGLFQLSGIEGSTIIPLLTINGQAPAPVGCYTNVSLPRAYRSLRADGLSGTNIIVGARLVDTSGSGVCTGFLTRDGQNLNTIFGHSTNVLYPILSAINPQLTVWHMKELGDIGEVALSNKLYNLEAMWKACITNGDVVYIGTPYESRDVQGIHTEIQNRLVREAAIRGNRAYIDCMTPCVSYDVMVQYRLLDDAVHPSPLGNSVMANTVVWPQLGLGRLAKGKPLESWPPPKPPLWLTNSAGPLSIYGWAAWSPEEGAIVLKNPTGSAASTALDAQVAFDLAPGAPQCYDMRRCDRWGRVPVASLRAGESSLVTLNASETVAIEAHPRIEFLSIEPYRSNLILRWPAGQWIKQSDSPNGAWSPSAEAISPWLISPTGTRRFYRAVTNLNN